MDSAGLDWALPAARWGLYVDLGVVFGMPVAAMLTGGRGVLERIRGLLALAALAGILLSAAGFWLSLAAMAAVPPGEVDAGLAKALLVGSALGGSLLVRVGALTACLVLILRQGNLRRGPLVVAGGIATATLAWAGHAAASQGVAGWVRQGGDILHLMAGLSWVGALLWFALLLWRPRLAASSSSMLRALSAFALAGSVIVAVLAVTGAANLLFLAPVSEWPGLAGRPYGQGLAIKLGLFAAMLALATLNRFLLVPMLARAPGERGRRAARNRLRASVTLELLAALALLGAVAWLGLLDPGG